MSKLIKVRTTCRCCGSNRIICSLPLAKVPIVSPNVGCEVGRQGEMLSREVAPLDTYLCLDCGLIQLVHVVDPALIYRNYLYRTSVSLGLSRHFRELAQEVVRRLELKPGDSVVEFGSNDGTLLGFFKERGMSVQGIDPAEGIAVEATRKGIPTRVDFFGLQTAREVRNERGLARVILANNAMANIDDLADILDGVRTLLAPDGAFVFETQYALDVFRNTLLDVIYHEHISCFSVQPVVKAMARFGLELFDAERISTKGGSIRFWVQHKGGQRAIEPRVAELIELERRTGLYDPAYHRLFGEKVNRIKNRLHTMIADVRARKRAVGAYGMSVGSAALIHQLELQDKLDLIFDDTPFKERLSGPGYDLPVYRGEGVYRFNPALIVILAWRYVEPITATHQQYIKAGGKFVVPLPDVYTIP